jgi:hypothetical protein
VRSVAASESLFTPIPLAGLSDAAYESDSARIATSRERAEATAAAAVESLRADGVHARWSIGRGNPAHHTEASVLIVREPLRVRSPEPVERVTRQPFGASASAAV